MSASSSTKTEFLKDVCRTIDLFERAWSFSINKVVNAIDEGRITIDDADLAQIFTNNARFFHDVQMRLAIRREFDESLAGKQAIEAAEPVAVEHPAQESGKQYNEAIGGMSENTNALEHRDAFEVAHEDMELLTIHEGVNSTDDTQQNKVADDTGESAVTEKKNASEAEAAKDGPTASTNMEVDPQLIMVKTEEAVTAGEYKNAIRGDAEETETETEAAEVGLDTGKAVIIDPEVEEGEKVGVAVAKGAEDSTQTAEQRSPEAAGKKRRSRKWSRVSLDHKVYTPFKF